MQAVKVDMQPCTAQKTDPQWREGCSCQRNPAMGQLLDTELGPFPEGPGGEAGGKGKKRIRKDEQSGQRRAQFAPDPAEQQENRSGK